MKKRVLAALLVTMMTVGTVAGCGSNAKSDDSDKKASSESKSDDKKDSGKKVTVVTSGTGEPYSLISDDGNGQVSTQRCGMKLKNVPDGK